MFTIFYFQLCQHDNCRVTIVRVFNVSCCYSTILCPISIHKLIKYFPYINLWFFLDHFSLIEFFQHKHLRLTLIGLWRKTLFVLGYKNDSQCFCRISYSFYIYFLCSYPKCFCYFLYIVFFFQYSEVFKVKFQYIN